MEWPYFLLGFVVGALAVFPLTEGAVRLLAHRLSRR